MTREARLGLNGPQVIEQEAGIAEYDSRDRPFIWGLTGGEQRYRTGLVDTYVDDDSTALRAAVIALFRRGRPAVERSQRCEQFLARLKRYDPAGQVTAEQVRQLLAEGAES